MVTTPPPPGPYPPQPPQRLRAPRSGRRVWPWVVGVIGVVVLVVVIGAIAWLGSTLYAGSQISSGPGPTHTYPQLFPEERLPAQVDGFKLDLDGPAVYQILRPSRENPNVVDVSRSDRIGFSEFGIHEGGVKKHLEYVDKETGEVEPGVYCTKAEVKTECFAASNSGRVWWTWDGFDSLTRKQLARWTAHFVAAIKE